MQRRAGNAVFGAISAIRSNSDNADGENLNAKKIVPKRTAARVFHCELNFIEMVWGYTKAALRKKCKFTFEDLRANVPALLDSVPLAFVRRASRHCNRFLSGYRRGFQGPILDYIMRKYKCHRTIPLAIANADLEREYETEKSKGKQK
eukprot:gene12511-14331_t